MSRVAFRKRAALSMCFQGSLTILFSLIFLATRWKKFAKLFLQQGKQSISCSRLKSTRYVFLRRTPLRARRLCMRLNAQLALTRNCAAPLKRSRVVFLFPAKTSCFRLPTIPQLPWAITQHACVLPRLLSRVRCLTMRRVRLRPLRRWLRAVSCPFHVLRARHSRCRLGKVCAQRICRLCVRMRILTMNCAFCALMWQAIRKSCSHVCTPCLMLAQRLCFQFRIIERAPT